METGPTWRVHPIPRERSRLSSVALPAKVDTVCMTGLRKAPAPGSFPHRGKHQFIGLTPFPL